MSSGKRIARRGTPTRRRNKKPSRHCPMCGRRFATVVRATEHRVAHRTAESLGLTLAEAETVARQVLREEGESDG